MPTSSPGPQIDKIDRILSMELVRVTERAAVAAARWRGRGDERQADQAAAAAMRRELDALPIFGTIVIGEGEADDTALLYVGEKVGSGKGPRCDIALDPLEGSTICAKNLPNAIAVIALAEEGSLLQTPHVYMEKIAIGPGYPAGVVDLDRPAAANVEALAAAKGVRSQEISACILDRPRHAKIIDEVRRTGAAIRLIGDGDVAGVIHTVNPDETGVDIYLGSGGAAEGVLAAAALRCMGGQMQGRLVLDRPEKLAQARAMDIFDPSRKYSLEDMARGDVLFAATGITDGNFLRGVVFGKDRIKTHTVVMRSATGTVRWIEGVHTHFAKFRLDEAHP